MKGILTKFTTVALVGFAILYGVAFSLTNLTYAEEEAEEEAGQETVGTSISITPVSKVLQLSASSTYDDVLSVTNDGNEQIRFEVYAAPYSYVYSEESDSYALGFSKENNYTQIARWIKIKDKHDNYVEKPTFTAEPGETVDVEYRVTTPDSIPGGGQYAVLFAHTLSNSSDASGIKTEASPGMVIYGRSDGEAIVASEFSDVKISQTITKEIDAEENGQTIKKEATLNHINAFAKVKNTGNIDFNARGVLKVEGILGGAYYETPENQARISVIPDSELILSDEWEDTPSFGLYKATWTVTAGDNTETTEMVICLIPPFVIIISIILLTIIIVWIIIMVRKRKERRSRLAV
ncbi:hypothetical protein IJJ53_02095 [Candidatus Saccharibacteria bacterium]|nr:hypothetical protein [Candidatus Saccharibacteria bacterium]